MLKTNEIQTENWKWEPEADKDGVRWRTKFGIEHGLEPKEAYELALAYAGVKS